MLVVLTVPRFTGTGALILTQDLGREVADTGDDAWRSAFESVFLGAVRLARVLAADLAAGHDGADQTGSRPGTGRS